MWHTLKQILYYCSICILCNNYFLFADTAQQSDTQDKINWQERTKNNLQILLGINDSIPEAKCQKDWQQKVCDGTLMCYATKCLYPKATIAMLHRIFLDTLIAELQNTYGQIEQERIAHLSNIATFGLPQDYKRHDFIFTNANNITCAYTLWQKDKKTLFFDLSGCLKQHNQHITRILIQHDLGVIETYQHIGY